MNKHHLLSQILSSHSATGTTQEEYLRQVKDGTAVVSVYVAMEFADEWAKIKIEETLRALKVINRTNEEGFLTCDLCGQTPSVIVTNEFGKFCQEHARYV